jgi:L-serine dehydratase
MLIRAEVDDEVIEREYYSVGGGFVVTAEELAAEKDAAEAIEASESAGQQNTASGQAGGGNRSEGDRVRHGR